MAPSRFRQTRRVLAMPAILVLVAAACGGSAPAPSSVSPTPPTPTATPQAVATPQPTPATEPSPARTPEATASSAPSVDANTFVSPDYRYALTLPPGTALVAWHRADRPWDGASRVHVAGPNMDRTAIAEGGLYIIGSPADSLDEFFTRFEANGPRFRGCANAEDRVDAPVNGVPAIGFTQVCGDDEADEFGRVALFKDGFGIGASIAASAGEKVPARDRLIELLGGLEWRTE